MAVKMRYGAVSFKERLETADIGKPDLPDNCLAAVNPELATEWHPTKNGDLTPDMVTRGSTKKVWWQCKQGHEWQAMIYNRSNGYGCPYCSGRNAIKGVNDLATANLKLASEWHPTKNGELTPNIVTKSSNKKVWWLGKCGHEWQATIASRTNLGSSCPYCSGQKALKGVNDLTTVNPKLATEWHPTRNGGLMPDMVKAGSGKIVWWQCRQGHEWQATIADRNNGTDCPYCSGRKALKGFNDLATVNPELTVEWHKTKNGKLTPYMVTRSSNKKVWWQCRQGHEWQATINSRNDGRGCPYCSGQKVLKGFNDLATVNHDLAAEWHQTKNDDLTPEMVSIGSSMKVWWQCKQGHEWQAAIYNRNKGKSCPYCSGRKVLKGFNDLATVNPKLTVEWHKTKNGKLTPYMVTRSSNKKVWWQCRQGHEWQATINSRSNGSGCPICNQELQTSFPEQVIYYYVQKAFPDAVNRDVSLGRELDIYIPSVHVAIEYDGSYFHNSVHKDKQKNEWCRKHGIRLFRIRECGCPDIAVGDVIVRKNGDDSSIEESVTELLRFLGVQDLAININADRNDIYNNYVLSIKKNSIAVEYPNLATEWHPTKNGGLTPDMVTKNSNKKVWWRCGQGHEWRAMINDRSRGNGCPYCSGKKVLKGFNDLLTERPEIAAEWHPTKNGGLTPDMVTKGSDKRIWWQCKQGHEWQTAIYNRSNGTCCPYCSGKKVLKGFNDLLTERLEIAAEWHPTKNGGLTPDMVTENSNKKVWWKCKQGHEWRATINNRNKDKGCPYCSRHKVLKGANDLETINPKLTLEWHPTKNGDLTPDTVMTGSSKKVWWRCNLGHEWQATIAHRSNGTGCPYCSGRHAIKGVSDLATVNPKLATEWHPTKNGNLTPDMVKAGSGKKVWWQCKQGHEWQATIYSRSNGYGCPICRKSKNKK